MGLLTLGETRSTIARVLGTCTTDSKIRDYVNEACQRLLTRGKWPGTYARYRICVNNSCITWPRQIETIEHVAICETPGVVRNDWFEFLDNSTGLLEEDDQVGIQLIDHGQAVAFDDVRGTDKRLRLYADSATDVGKRVLLKYYNDTANKVYTLSGTTWIEGEYVTLVAPPAYALSAYECMANGLYGVVKDTTNQVVRLYCYDTVGLTQYALAYYEPDETVPVYRRSFIPGIQDMATCESDDAACANKSVEVMAKLRYIAAVNDTDYLMIGNLPAIKDMVMAIVKAERNVVDEAEAYEARAIRELQNELVHYHGDGAVVAVRTQDAYIWGAGRCEGVV